MKPLLIACCLALCGLAVAQWFREAEVRRLHTAAGSALDTARADLAALRDTLTARDAEVVRLTALQQATVAERDAAKQEVVALTEKLAALTAAGPPPNPEAVAKRNAEITAQNEALARQNEALKKLAAERDDLARRLDERTKEWNALVKKTGAR